MNFPAWFTTTLAVASFVVPWLVVACAMADKYFPVPRPGSKWIGFRQFISKVGQNEGYAINRIVAGSTEATVTPLDVIRHLTENHEETLSSLQSAVAPIATLADTVAATAEVATQLQSASLPSAIDQLSAKLDAVSAPMAGLPGKLTDITARVNNVAQLVVKATPLTGAIP